ncbi:MAG TPA: RNA methyltransferase [Thermoleophilaceae bacterium]|nr:RNA methyltransferase [Thermoleophilaceae bacterium]
MIRSPDNDRLKTIRKLQQKRWREKLGLFAAEGEDLVEAAWKPEFVLWAGEDVEPELLAAVSSLGSGTRVIGVYEQRWADPTGDLLVYLHGVEDPGNVGTIIRSAHALADATVVLGPGCADPWSPKAVRASMGSIFARPPARAPLGDLRGHLIALDAGSGEPLGDVALPEAPAVLCLGAEREGLPAEVLEGADAVAHIPLRAGGPESLNVAMAATVALYEVERRMRGHA